MNRRDFLKSVSGAAVALPLAGVFGRWAALKATPNFPTNTSTSETTGFFSDITIDNGETVIYGGWYDDTQMRITSIKRIRNGIEIENLIGLDIPYQKKTGTGVHFY